MSWFNDLASKAEALLVKLDQDAAQALQNPDGILRATKLSDITSAIKDDNLEYDTIPKEEETSQEPSDDSRNNGSQNLDPLIEVDISQNFQPKKDLEGSLQYSSEQTSVRAPETFAPEIMNEDDVSKPILMSGPLLVSPETQRSLDDNIPGKFTIQTSKHRSRPFLYSRKGKSKVSRGQDETISKHDRSANGEITVSPGADDIRASINRSLQEYSIQTPKRVSHNGNNSFNAVTSNSSHYDNQPNLVEHSPSTESNYHRDLHPSLLHPSPSFSIDVPEDNLSNRSTSDLATRLFEQGALKKKSTFYLHKVINRLANSDGQTRSIIADQTRIKFRRAQLRASSYARRLNYFFRTYPMMKYVVVCYLVLLQLLVVYVLFFYQSSSSSNDLSAQIKRQQEEIVESKLNSEIDQVTKKLTI